MLQPVDELLDERVDAGAPGVEPDVRLLVSRAPRDAPSIVKPSGRSSASIPSARNPATRTAMRSLSFTRSSPAPRTSTRPPCAASAAIAGSSSMSTACQSSRFASAFATVVLPAAMKPTR